MNKQFLLEQDLIEKRQTKAYVDGKQIVQENGTNPRIRRVSRSSSNNYALVSESYPEYEMRVILGSGVPPLNPQSLYEIEWISGVKTKYKSVDIRQSNNENLYVTIMLSTLPNQLDQPG